MRLFLTGFMGSGKTVVGREVASLLACPFLDLDELIERRAGESIATIFSRLGESAFRELESTVIRETQYPGSCVVATGGGALVDSDNLAFAKACGSVVWLNPTFDTMAQRIGCQGEQDRPLFSSRQEAEVLYRSRLPAYEKADLQLDVSAGETISEVARRIVERMRHQVCDT
ncbi:MAG: shikimate kinase [Thermoanaerobaculia bacterium]|nr:shikimate kinase [Thermoanaerobaculia bacterium]